MSVSGFDFRVLSMVPKLGDWYKVSLSEAGKFRPEFLPAWLQLSMSKSANGKESSLFMRWMVRFSMYKCKGHNDVT